MIPVAYAPNNDLYISADQGGFEIINAHPGTALYTKLDLVGNWGGSGKSLLDVVVAPSPRIIGLSGFTTWPEADSVNHVEITDDVLVFFDDTQQEYSIIVENKDGVIGTYTPVDNKITIPVEALENSIENKIKITLYDGETAVSYIISLPISESEDFSIDGKIDDQGDFDSSARNSKCTDFIDVELITDIAYTGISQNALWAYDENRNPIKKLLYSWHEDDTLHVAPDGTYKYIRACASTQYAYALIVYYRNRG